MKQLVILAGGKGTRLKERLGDLPKPMIPIGGRPLLEHQIELARRHGFKDVLMLLQHRAELIQKHFQDGAAFGVRLRYVVEERPLGTAGAVLACGELLAERFAVMYGDTMLNVDLDRFWRAHSEGGVAATLFLHPNNHPMDSDLVEVDAAGIVTAFHNRPHPSGRWFQNLVNAGLYVVEKRPLLGFGETHYHREPAKTGHLLDFGMDVFPSLLAKGEILLGYNSPEFIKDIGTPSRYDWVCDQYSSGIIQRSSLEHPQRAVFLDRDGTLVREVGGQGLAASGELELLPGAAEAVHALNQAGWRAVVVTNQPVIAKGFCTEDELKVIHDKLETLLGLEHAYLDRIYHCPHHPEKGHPGERPELKIKCDCRKPATGMIRRAVSELNIDPSQSWMVGDTTTDIQTARNAGLRSLLVRTGYGGGDGHHTVSPERACDNVLDAVRHILAQAPR